MYQFKKTNPYYSEVNKKENWKLKCENGDNIIDKFGGLKSKIYVFSYATDYDKFLNSGVKLKLVRCKGTTRTTVKDNIYLDTMINTLNDNSFTKLDNYCIRS